ncbi:MAG: adenosylcobinamide-phosphate synthase CbiB [Acetobacteraceae bacterium]
MTEANLLILAGALALEAVAGYPDPVFRAMSHPVVWAGALIGALDRGLNRPTWTPAVRRCAGAAALLLLLLASAGPAALLQALLLPYSAGLAVLVLAAATLPAQRSLWSHVRAVGDALDGGGVAAGRAAVAHIVGRDPATLDAAGVVRAAIESLAENFSDGVVAPAVWGALLGLPGMAAYKAVNTADSMIGHRSARHAAFGWAAARFDDVVNLPASRLAALFLIAAAAMTPGADPSGAVRAVRRDARHHRSPNAGWPEAAMAGALGLRLAGPRTYAYGRVEDAWMGNGRAEATTADLRRALALYRLACLSQFATVLAALGLVASVLAPG